MKEYCYKVKHSLLKVEYKGIYYKKPLIENYGFYPVQQDFTNEKGETVQEWTGIWAKKIEFSKDCGVAKWLKRNIEGIYKKEKEIKDSKWVKDILESGYEFDDEGNLIENEAFLSGLNGLLCIDSEGAQASTLYIDLSGCVAFYDLKTIVDAVPNEVEKLLAEDVIYKAVLVLKERKKAKAKRQFVQSGQYVRPTSDEGHVKVTIAEDAMKKDKVTRKDKKDPNGRFLIKTKYGYATDKDVFVSDKNRAFIFTDFKLAKKVANKMGGKVVKL